MSKNWDVPALLAFHRQTFGDLRMEVDGGEGAGGSEGGNDGGNAGTNNGGDAGKTFTPITSQEDFDARLSDRLKRERAKFADYDDLKTKAAEADRLRQEQESASERAVREAREQAAAEERAKNAPRLVSAEFRAAAKGVLTAEQTTSLLEDLDLSKYLDDKGEVDTAKVEKKIAAFAPVNDGKGKFPDLGQGKRDSKPTAGVASGREMYEAKRGKPAA